MRTLSDEEADRLGPTSPEVADEVVLKIGAPPVDLAAVLNRSWARRSARVRASAHHGSRRDRRYTRRVLRGKRSGAAGFVEEMREIWVRRGGNVTLQRAPLTLKQRVSTWDNGGLSRSRAEGEREVRSPGRHEPRQVPGR